MKADQTVHVVDDESDIRTLLQDMLATADLRVKTYASAQEILQTYDSDCPGCLLLDIGMPDMDGLQLMEALARVGNRAPVIFLTGSGNIAMAVEALKSGAVDFIEKPPRMDALLNCVRKALDKDLRDRYEYLQYSLIEERYKLLSPREHEVLSLIIQGKSNKAIARILDISSRTVEIHRKNVIEKMQANSVADLVKMGLAIRH
jgi:two-component system, LuxR family, response regulator FixJ